MKLQKKKKNAAHQHEDSLSKWKYVYTFVYFCKQNLINQEKFDTKLLKTPEEQVFGITQAFSKYIVN